MVSGSFYPDPITHRQNPRFSWASEAMQYPVFTEVVFSLGKSRSRKPTNKKSSTN